MLCLAQFMHELQWRIQMKKKLFVVSLVVLVLFLSLGIINKLSAEPQVCYGCEEGDCFQVIAFLGFYNCVDFPSSCATIGEMNCVPRI